MRRLTRCLAAGLVLVAAPLTACGSDDGEPEQIGAAEAGSTTTTAAAVPDVQPDAALLTLDDLPDGYVVDSSQDSAEDAPFGGCAELRDMDESAADDERTAQVVFLGGEESTMVFHAVGDQDAGTAAREFDNFRAALRKPECQTFQETSNGRTATWTLSPLSTVRVGDDTVAFRLSGDAVALNMTFDFAAERIGDNVSMVGTARVPAVGGALPPDLSALLQRAHQKLAQAVA